ncbi:hypothetical protein HDV06_006951 [Boothiomyces sp. JEL0866]|nr:hypothetical protein HDV06_006951 [Boothiomyces sp. JEL0866]
MEAETVTEPPQEPVAMAEPEQSEQPTHPAQTEQIASNEEKHTSPEPPKEPVRESTKKSNRKQSFKNSTHSVTETKRNSDKKEAKIDKNIKIEKSESFQQIDPLEKVEAPNLAPSIVEVPKKIVDPYPYRHYITFHPCVNKLLDMKWDRTLRIMHLKKLKAVKSNVDNKAPTPLRHLSYKLKKIQMENDRQAEIYRNNRILLERMSAIMYLEAHDPEIHQTKYPQICTNAGTRAREQIRISIENKKMLQRLESKQPHYNHKALDVDRYKNLAYLQNISSFPQKFVEQRQEYLQKIKQKKPKIVPVNNLLRKTFLNTIDTSKYVRRFEKKVLPEIRPKTSNLVEKSMMDALSDGSASDKPVETAEPTPVPVEAPTVEA